MTFRVTIHQLLVVVIALSCARSDEAEVVASQSRERVTIAHSLQKEEADKLNKQGVGLMQAGNADKALEAFDRALELFRQAGDPEGEATVLANSGLGYSSKGEWGKARERYTQALPFFQKNANRVKEAELLAGIALTFDGEGNPRSALAFYRQAIPLLRAESDRSREAMVLIAAGKASLALGEKQSALDLLLSTLPLLRYLENPTNKALALELIGAAYVALDNNKEALSYYEQSLGAWEAAGDLPRQAGVHTVVAGIEMYFGHYEEALRHYDESLSTWRALHDETGQSRLLSSIGNFYASLGDFQRGFSYYHEALVLSQRLDDPVGRAGLLYDLGYLRALQQAKAEALVYFDQSLALWHSLGRTDREAQTLTLMGKACSWVGDYQQAASFLARSLSLWQRTKLTAGEVDALSVLAMIYGTMVTLHIPVGSGVEIAEYLNQVLRRIHDIDDPKVRALMLGRAGLIYTLVGDLEKAVDYQGQALRLSEDSRDQNGMAIGLSNMGLAYESKGRFREALGFYERSIDIQDKIRSSAHLDDIRTGLSGLTSNAYGHAAGLLMQSGETARAFEFTERARARTLLDQLANVGPRARRKASADLLRQEQSLRAELAGLENKLKLEESKTGSSFDRAAIASVQDHLSSKRSEYEDLLTRLKLADPAYASLRTVNALTLHEVQALIGKDTTLISYFVTDKMTMVFVVTRDSLRTVVLGVREPELEKEIDWFRQFSKLDSNAPESLKRLHEQLIAPLLRYISTSVVAIVPHGVLNYLPFAALTDGQRYFGEEHDVYYLPSASVLPFIQKQNRPSRNYILAIAQSRANGLPDLRYADEEANSVAAIFRVKMLATGKTSKKELLRLAGDCRVLHITAHGELNPSSPLFSRIWLAPNEDIDDGALAVHEVYDMDLSNVDLVTLSACETQLGARSTGDDIVGLNRAFLYAGAHSVIASLWAVDDRATCVLMRSFYTNLKRGMGKAEALRVAQSETRRQYPNPYYWAAFVLTGDPGLSGPIPTDGPHRRTALHKK